MASGTDTVVGFSVEWRLGENRECDHKNLLEAVKKELGLADKESYELLGVLDSLPSLGIVKVLFGHNSLGGLMFSSLLPKKDEPKLSIRDEWKRAKEFFKTHRDTVKGSPPILYESIITTYHEHGHQMVGLYDKNYTVPFIQEGYDTYIRRNYK